MILRGLALIGVVSAFPVLARADGEFPAAARPCITCHGRDGFGTTPDFPNLAGQGSIYLMQQLTAFRDGTRHSEVMNIAARDLNDSDIRAIAEYYESRPACR